MGRLPARPCPTAPYSLPALLVTEALANFVRAVEPNRFIGHCRPFNLVASSRPRSPAVLDRGRPLLLVSLVQFNDLTVISLDPFYLFLNN